MIKEEGQIKRSMHEILMSIINDTNIRTLQGLKESSLGILDNNNLSLDQIFNEHRRQRTYLLKQVVKFLYHSNNLPRKAIEVGSAGDISLALAIDHCHVTSVDVDKMIFGSVPYNSIPSLFFKHIRRKKKIEGYGGFDLMRRKRKKLKFVQQVIPNWHYRVEDANNLSDTDSSFELAIVQGTPDMLEFINELARVIKPGGYIVSMVGEDFREGDYISAYVQERYVNLSEYKFISDEDLSSLKLERVDIPKELKQYEELSHSYDNGVRVSAGYVFEIFRSVKSI